TVAIDPRMELLSIVQSLGEYASKFPVMTKHSFSYRSEVEAAFAPWRDHQAVRIFDRLSQRPYTPEAPAFYFGAPPEAMLYLLPDFTLHPDIYLNEFLVNRAGGRESLEEFIAAMQDFCRQADFHTFYAKHQPTYQQLVQTTSEAIGTKPYVEILEAFYGQQQKSYTLVLIPLYGSVGFGPHLECVDGTRNIYSILGPKTVENGLPAFGTQSYFDRMLIHELSHSFINPLTEQYRKEVDQLARPDLVTEVSAKSGYGEWYDVVNEYIIRAITAHFAYQDSREKGDQELANCELKGFRAVAQLLDPIRRYAADRERYVGFSEFYPELLLALAQAK
ncbi:MAG: DUF4932 domain-containing protein, partial [Bacillota bacterium]